MLFQSRHCNWILKKRKKDCACPLLPTGKIIHLIFAKKTTWSEVSFYIACKYYILNGAKDQTYPGKELLKSNGGCNGTRLFLLILLRKERTAIQLKRPHRNM